MKTVLLFIAIIFVSSCQTTSYTHLTKNEQGFESDDYVCKKIAKRGLIDSSYQENPILIEGEINRCLEEKGWTLEINE